MNALLDARTPKDNPGKIPVGDMIAIIDGGRDSSQFLRDFGLIGKEPTGRKGHEGKTAKRNVTLIFDQKSVMARVGRQKVRGHPARCSQTVHCFCNGQTKFDDVELKHFPHLSSSTDWVGPFCLLKNDDLQTMNRADKIPYWAKRRIAVGGRSLDEDEVPSSSDEDQDGLTEPPMTTPVSNGRWGKLPPEDMLQPINYHSLPRQVYDTLAHMFGAFLRIDCCPGDGTCLFDTLKQRQNYVGLCQSSVQLKHLHSKLVDEVLACMCDPSCVALHSPAYATWKTNAANTASNASPEPAATGVTPATTETTPAKAGITPMGNPNVRTRLSPGLQSMLAAATGTADGTPTNSM